MQKINQSKNKVYKMKARCCPKAMTIGEIQKKGEELMRKRGLKTKDLLDEED